jgi:microcystin-dependent protein
MAKRIEIPFVVDTLVEVELKPVSTPVVGASVTITHRSDSSGAVVFAAETGSGTIVPTTDKDGKIVGWLPEGTYDIEVNGGKPTIAPTIYGWDALPGDGVEQVGEESVTLKGLVKAVQEALVPSGTILPFGGDAAPEGYVLTDGTSYLRTAHAKLFGVIGTKYGTADGTHFNVPDTRGRVVVGAGAGPGLTVRTVGDKAGEENHVLSIGELAAHTHTVPPMGFGVSVGGSLSGSASDHTHGHPNQGGGGDGAGYLCYKEYDSASKVFGATLGTPGRTAQQISGLGTPNSNERTGNSGSLGVSVSGTLSGGASTPSTVTSSTGTNTGHNNMQPFTVANNIIKL